MTKRRKERVMVGIPAWQNRVNVSLFQMAYDMPIISMDPKGKREFWVHADGGVRPQEFCRNRICGEFLKSKCDVLLMIDDDMIFQGWNTLALLDTPDYDIAGPIQMMFLPQCSEKRPEAPEVWTCATVRDPSGSGMRPVFPTAEMVPTKVDAVGSGCMAIRRHVLEDERMLLEPGWDPPALWRQIYQPNGDRIRGLDIDFCYRATDLGYRVIVNWNAQIGHLKEVDVNQIELYAKSQWRAGFEFGGKHAVQMDQGQGSAEGGSGAGSDAGRHVDEAVARGEVDRAG